MAPLMPGQHLTVTLLKMTIPVAVGKVPDLGPVVSVHTSMPLNVLSTATLTYTSVLDSFSTYSHFHDLEIERDPSGDITKDKVKVALAYDNPDPANSTVTVWGRGVPDTVRFWVTVRGDGGKDTVLQNAEWSMVLLFDVVDSFATEKTHSLLSSISNTLQLQLLRDNFFLSNVQTQQQQQQDGGRPAP